ncbi:leucine-rich repeat-containing protein 55 [Mergus octosetaceus]|uniref:Leucine rich repeat containing 55 n=5 Tax=Anatidae TaxID=8830 RepID=A0A493TS11_ANAPP|nr:leucine-rich repeat-containing protein 55 [Anas platyrhynchos]XP_035167579.1 leucine-rich repeat-containing protein 55-like [Oxyura jamaicensis]XP_035167589.1 leucine-rich repeat-containing protein 55-like [Oxyura jamaicensis]XP_035406275.1 leucine-rich repeat-containing protein 55 [Cygnus atratus]XP_040415685.1 leucine-rich repeat-containing protein 55 [Cygnus olor]XP_040415686.1 leucine-rich repeat-containing protein 55 [Cygnus olor]XP_047915818.1 leucine-rich repeat-containing protein 5|eukprot:XP_027314033.1 leucine-rich repeat-containing protein 55 [Anas platyrhynchos]
MGPGAGRRPAMLLGPWVVAAAAVVAAAGAGAGCPVLCTCRGQAVDCSGQRLFSVPAELPLDTGNLSLAHNRIASIPLGYLACYAQLRVLDLRNNSLETLPTRLFLGARRLTHLDLSYNNFSLVTADMFLEASELLRLDLSHNPWLCKVHPKAFRGLAQLRELDLSYGGLSALSLDALEGLTGLVTLRIGGNPWVCGCAMEPFLKWLKSRIQLCASDSQLAKCQAPLEVKGVPLFSLTEESFKACHLTLTLDDYLFIAFVGFVVSIASVATNFLLGITANCCHRWSKASEDEEV